MAEAHQHDLNRLALDGTRLLAVLNSASSREEPEKLALSLPQWREQYAELVRQHESLSASSEDAALIRNILDNIRTRLKFLVRGSRRKWGQAQS
jgi:hypothetical protein